MLCLHPLGDLRLLDRPDHGGAALPRYVVTIEERVGYLVTVDAPGEDTASERAEQAFLDARDQNEYLAYISDREVIDVERCQT